MRFLARLVVSRPRRTLPLYPQERSPMGGLRLAARLALLALVMAISTRAGNAQTWTQQGKLIASDRGVGDQFGISVSISGDYAIAGANLATDTATHSGAAYIFQRTGSTWTQQAKLHDTDSPAWDCFGVAVAISGSCALVGAEKGAGVVYAYEGSGTAWSRTAVLSPAAGMDDHMFGAAVALDGDYAIVGDWAYGSPFGTQVSQYSGAVYMFHRSGSGWQQQAMFLDPRNLPMDWFGGSVAISGDYAIVGSPHGGGSNVAAPGQAYIFHRTDSTWELQATLVPSNSGNYDEFGQSVSINGNCVAVAGAGTFIFQRNGSAWTQTASVNGGGAVALSGSVLAVGPVPAQLPGQVDVYAGAGSTWTHTATLQDLDPGSVDMLGWSLAIDGSEIIAGAPGKDPNYYKTGEGAAYVFVVPEPGTVSLLAAMGLVLLRRRRT